MSLQPLPQQGARMRHHHVVPGEVGDRDWGKAGQRVVPPHHGHGLHLAQRFHLQAGMRQWQHGDAEVEMLLLHHRLGIQADAGIHHRGEIRHPRRHHAQGLAQQEAGDLGRRQQPQMAVLLALPDAVGQSGQPVMPCQHALGMLVEAQPLGREGEAAIVAAEQVEAQLPLQRRQQAPDLRLGAPQPQRAWETEPLSTKARNASSDRRLCKRPSPSMCAFRMICSL
jgi:hypothetical protein